MTSNYHLRGISQNKEKKMADIMEKDVLLSMPHSISARIFKAVRNHPEKELDKLEEKYALQLMAIRDEYYSTNHNQMDFTTEINRLKSLEAEFYKKAGLFDYFEKKEAERKETLKKFKKI